MTFSFSSVSEKTDIKILMEMFKTLRVKMGHLKFIHFLISFSEDVN